MAIRDFDPLHAFAHAERFRTSVGVLNRADQAFEITTKIVDDIPPAPYPMLTLAALGTEIFLKCIRRLVGLKVAGHHNLWSHYKSIHPIKHKEAIELYYEDVIQQSRELNSLPKESGIPLQLKEVLKESRDIFDILRYVYEEGRSLPEQRILNMGFVMEAARRYALELLVSQGRLFLLLAEAERKGKDVKAAEDGERLPINKDTENLRKELRRLFAMRFEGDPFSVSDLDLAVLQQVGTDNT